ncbi:MAG: type II secretion system protein [Pseudomonadota bacterium]
MPISRDNAHSPPFETASADQGFSLVEVLVVLAIFSVLAGIVGVNVRKAVHSVKLEASRDAVVQIVRTTRAQATFASEFVPFDNARRGHPIEAGEQTIFFAESSGVRRFGVCDEAAGRVQVEGRTYDFQIDPVTCVVRHGR